MSRLDIAPLGGMSSVTQNMFLYVYEQEILIIDCGIGFPDKYMPGVDVLIPDISHLLQLVQAGKKIVGMVLSHGHDDHIAATPYLLPELPEFPIYASPLTAGFTEQRMKDGKVQRKINLLTDRQPVQIGRHFRVTSYAITHSVPDTKHLAIETPAGLIYHGSDFKIDKQPIDGVTCDFESFRLLKERKVLCMLVDCLRVERREWTPSESLTGPAISKAMSDTKGKYIITLMSSHIHRIQQTVDAAREHGRKVVFIGRSVEQNVEIALRLGKLTIPQGMMVDKRDIADYRDEELCVIIAGSQGQEGSSLVRAVYGEHRSVQIKPDDKVVFSADAIPGNEVAYFAAIDELSRNNVDVIYPDVVPDLHKSGHASAAEQKELIKTIEPEFVMPIGGADRHRVKFKEFVSRPLGYADRQVLLPRDGDVVSFDNGRPAITASFELKPRAVDGLGIGDVGPQVLSDRRTLAQAGMIVIIMPRFDGHLDLENILVVSRGFVFMKQADEVIAFIKKETAQIVSNLKGSTNDQQVSQAIERQLSRKLFKVIRREPMIVPVIYDI